MAWAKIIVASARPCKDYPGAEQRKGRGGDPPEGDIDKPHSKGERRALD